MRLKAVKRSESCAAYGLIHRLHPIHIETRFIERNGNGPKGEALDLRS